jgi:selenide,water dikinase
MNTSATPIEKNVVLVGAGNAHLVFLRKWGMRPIPGVAVTLVSEASVIPYSAMVPAHVGGEYTRDEITIDLVRLCSSVGVRFVAQRVAALDPANRRVNFAGRPGLSYDVLSLGVGSLPAIPADSAPDGFHLLMRPLGTLLRRLDAIHEGLRANPRPFHLAVVGGGASGCELAIAVRKRFDGVPNFRMTLLQANERLLPHFPRRVARKFAGAFAARGIEFRTGARVTGAAGGALAVAGGEPVPCDAVLWATQAAPSDVIRNSGLTVNADGFLRVAETLQSVSHPGVFGTGDCVAFDGYPDLARSGVYAVKQGAVLFDNVEAFLHERPMRPFRPRRWCLYLLNTGDGKAVYSYGPFTWRARWVRRLKDRIDRRWIAKFRDLGMKPAVGAAGHESPLMRCGGCGAKIAGDVLSAVLRRLDIPDDPRVLLGVKAGEDAAVHPVRPELFGKDPAQLVEVQTVDYFKAFVDDPYLFGRIAALNAVSDLYAMNARPFSALAIATLPYARGPVQESQLYELLSGALESFRTLGVVLTGGHTSEGAESALGFCVTGFAERDRLFRKANLKPGDVLILTKPVGSGALLAAWMRGQCRAAWFDALVAAMLSANDKAGAIFAESGATACTDVTGFGLAGHLLEMLEASRAGARLAAKCVPLYDGFEDVVAAGIVSTLHADNAKVAARVRGAGAKAGWLFDPQTSGGLLAAVRPERVTETLRRLHEAGLTASAAIGEVTADGAGTITVE